MAQSPLATSQTLTPSPAIAPPFSRSEHTTKHVTYQVPLTPNRGTSHRLMTNALNVAHREYNEMAKDFPDAPPADEGIHIAPGKDELVIYFVLEDRK